MSLTKLVILRAIIQLLMVGCLFVILGNLFGCGNDNLLAEGHYRTDIHWTHSDWSGTQLPPDDVQVWTITGDDDKYHLVLPGSDNIVHGYEAKNAAVFQLGVKATQPGDLSPFLKVVLQRSNPDKDDAYNGHGEACVWLGYALMCERVDVSSSDYVELD